MANPTNRLWRQLTSVWRGGTISLALDWSESCPHGSRLSLWLDTLLAMPNIKAFHGVVAL